MRQAIDSRLASAARCTASRWPSAVARTLTCRTRTALLQDSGVWGSRSVTVHVQNRTEEETQKRLRNRAVRPNCACNQKHPPARSARTRRQRQPWRPTPGTPKMVAEYLAKAGLVAKLRTTCMRCTWRSVSATRRSSTNVATVPAVTIVQIQMAVCRPILNWGWQSAHKSGATALEVFLSWFATSGPAAAQAYCGPGE